MVRSLGLLVMAMCIVSCRCTPTPATSAKANGGAVAKNNKTITGEIGTFNSSQNDIVVDRIVAGTYSDGPGVVGPGGAKVMGFAELQVGGRLEIHWDEEEKGAQDRSYMAEFRSEELADVADRVKGFKFTYLGKQAWQLEVYQKLHMKDEDRIKTIKSVRSFAVGDDAKKQGTNSGDVAQPR